MDLKRQTTSNSTLDFQTTLTNTTTLHHQQTREQDANPRCKRATAVLTPLLSLWTLTAVLSIVYMFYVHKSLLSPDPHIGNLLLTASNTNLVVSILSQALANLVEVLFMGALDILRWQLATRRKGVESTTFFQLSSSTGWVSVFWLTVVKPSLGSMGGVFRLLLPLFGLLFGSILKCRPASPFTPLFSVHGWLTCYAMQTEHHSSTTSTKRVHHDNQSLQD